ncbi:MAG TPA: hypothetical protein VI542_09790 [Candidatus Tectomicrobia bacterium]
MRQQHEARFDPHGVRERLLARRLSPGQYAMLVLAADENFNGNIIRGLVRRELALDLVRLHDVGLSGAEDPAVLAWAAQERWVLLPHDVSSITRPASPHRRWWKGRYGTSCACWKQGFGLQARE